MENKNKESMQCLFNNEKGSLSILGLTCFLMLFSLLLVYFYFQVDKVQQTKVHTKSLLCLKTYFVGTNKYLTNMELLNKAILAANVIRLIPATKAAGEAAKRSAQLAQQIIHVAYLKKTIFQNNCQMQNKVQFYKNQIMKTKGVFILKRKKGIGTVTQRKRWEIKFTTIYRKKFLDFVEVSSSNTSIKITRKAKMGLAIWNSSFGSL